jgi:type IV pilus assembly protein PilA
MIKALMKKIRKSNGGFTLIELIVVIAILAILAAVLIPTISGQIAKASISRGDSDANSAYTACTMALSQLETAGTALTTNDEDEVISKAKSYCNNSTLDCTLAEDTDGNISVKTASVTEGNYVFTYTEGSGVSHTSST